MQIQKPSDLARIIKTRRQSLHLTQQEIASAVGITRQSLARVERGHAGTSFDTVLRIFERLGLQLASSPANSAPVTVSFDTEVVAATEQAVAAAASAAAGPLPGWRSSLSNKTELLVARAADAGLKLTSAEARVALLDAAIEALDLTADNAASRNHIDETTKRIKR